MIGTVIEVIMAAGIPDPLTENKAKEILGESFYDKKEGVVSMPYLIWGQLKIQLTNSSLQWVDNSCL